MLFKNVRDIAIIPSVCPFNMPSSPTESTTFVERLAQNYYRNHVMCRDQKLSKLWDFEMASSTARF